MSVDTANEGRGKVDGEWEGKQSSADLHRTCKSPPTPK